MSDTHGFLQLPHDVRCIIDIMVHRSIRYDKYKDVIDDINNFRIGWVISSWYILRLKG